MIETINSIAGKWFTWEFAMLWQVTVLIAIVAAVDFLIKKWAWPQVRYALWMLVMVKLILPPTLTSPSSFTAGIPSLAEKVVKVQISQPAAPQIYQTAKPYEPAAPAATVSAGSLSNDSQTVTKSAPTRESTKTGKIYPIPVVLSLQSYAFVVWLAGIAVLSGWLIIRLSSLRREHLKNERQANPPERFKDLLAATAQKLKLRKVPQIILTDKVCCPAVFGVFRPVLLMPADKLGNLTRQDAEHILLHELAHIKRGDLFIHAVYMMLQIAYWFNPLLWLIRKHLQNLRELCCDATVAGLLKDKTFGYRKTLLETARQLLAEPASPGLGLLGLFENSNWLVDRLKWLEKKTWKNRPLRIVTIFVLVCLMATCVMPMAKFEPGPPGFVVKGTVSDAETGQPIAGAKVGDNNEYNGGKFCAVTDSNGNYEYKTWYEEHNINAVANGYKTEQKILLTTLFSSEKGKVIDFALEPKDYQEPESKNAKIPQEFIGHWKGQGKIIVNWTKQRWLSIDIEIKPDGTVTGQVGDSQLENAVFKLSDWLRRKFNPKGNWMVRGDLVGPVIKNENIKREYINLLFDDIGEDGKIKGGFSTSGWKIGNKDTMVMSGMAMVLEKVSANTLETPKKSDFTATLPNGVTVELVGVCEHPSEGKQWWKPDGNLLENAPYEKMRTVGITPAWHRKAMEAAIKIEGFKEQIGFRYTIDGAQNSGSSGSGDRKLFAVSFDQAKENSQTNIKIGIGAGPWQTVMTKNSDFDGVYSHQDIIWHGPAEKKAKLS